MHRADRRNFIAACTRLAALDNGPARVEGGQAVDSAGMPTSSILAYWTGPDAARYWCRSDEVAAYWRALPSCGDTGYFVKRMTIPHERFNCAAGTEDKHGSAAILPLEA